MIDDPLLALSVRLPRSVIPLSGFIGLFIYLFFFVFPDRDLDRVLARKERETDRRDCVVRVGCAGWLVWNRLEEIRHADVDVTEDGCTQATREKGRVPGFGG